WCVFNPAPRAPRVPLRVCLRNPPRRLGHNPPLPPRPRRKAEPEKLPLLRSRHRTLRFVHLELELVCDESRDAFHHPLTRLFAPNVNVTVVRVTNKTVSPALQLPVEFVEHEIAEQWRKWTSLWSPFHARADQPVLHHPGIQECPDDLQQPLVLDAFG